MLSNIARRINERPVVGVYQDPAEFVRDMIQFRRRTDRSFSVQKATRSLRRLSPALVSLVMKKKRKLTLDRVEEFSRLLSLNSTERIYFRNWIQRLERSDVADLTVRPSSRKTASPGLLNDWINVYVKDLFHLEEVQKDPQKAERLMAAMASNIRVRRALEFLVREGHLRRTPEGHLVIEANLTVADSGVPSRKVRQFHKGVLSVARQAIDLYSFEERTANALLIPLNERRYQELQELLQDFAERLQNFAAEETVGADRLYQLLINLSPIGGKVK